MSAQRQSSHPFPFLMEFWSSYSGQYLVPRPAILPWGNPLAMPLCAHLWLHRSTGAGWGENGRGCWVLFHSQAHMGCSEQNQALHSGRDIQASVSLPPRHIRCPQSPFSKMHACLFQLQSLRRCSAYDGSFYIFQTGALLRVEGCCYLLCQDNRWKLELHRLCWINSCHVPPAEEAMRPRDIEERGKVPSIFKEDRSEPGSVWVGRVEAGSPQAWQASTLQNELGRKAIVLSSPCPRHLQRLPWSYFSSHPEGGRTDGWPP